MFNSKIFPRGDIPDSSKKGRGRGRGKGRRTEEREGCIMSVGGGGWTPCKVTVSTSITQSS